MTREEARQEIIDYLDHLPNLNLVDIHNDYCYNTNYYDDEIMEIEEIDHYFSNMKPYDIMCRAVFGDFDANAEYFKFDGYGNIQSIHECEIKDYIYTNEIADYCVYDDEDLSDKHIRDLLDEIDEDEDEDEEE